MADQLTKEQRSAQMARIRATANASTETRVESALRREEVGGWVKHPGDVAGRPDFYFPNFRLALFVDGCFWHACPKCGRIPKTRVGFWKAKLEANRQRDFRVTRRLRADGYHVIRVWEHELSGRHWLARLRRIVRVEPALATASDGAGSGKAEGSE